MPEVYTHGHHESVLRSHSWRTAENSAAYLLPHLKPHMKILDVGCGPGTITAGLARYVPEGRVTGIEPGQAVIDQARQAADSSNIEFTTGDVYALDYPDDTFCVTHAHQVLQHLADPVKALKEMRRVTKPGGLVAVRDADYGAMFWYPASPALEEWRNLYRRVARGNGGEPDAARRLHVWAREAGLGDVTVSASTWTYSAPDEREWWGGTWADRTLKSSYAESVITGGHAAQEDLERIARGWRDWTRAEDGWFCVVNGEVLGRVLCAGRCFTEPVPERYPPGMGAYEDAFRRGIDDPEGFWGEAARGIDWFTQPQTILDRSNPPFYRWFPGGTLNTCYNAVDRHVEAGRGDQAALIYDSPVTDTKREYTFQRLRDETATFGGALKSLGVAKGDRVIIYMPMIPEAVIAMLACARIGAVHSVVFGGFAPHELAVRIDDAKPKVIVSASCGIEGKRVIEYKPILDAAIEEAEYKPARTVVLQRPQAAAPLTNPDRDLDWRVATAEVGRADCVPVDATDPLYILYTSGTTGKPKGVVRDNGGHAVALNWSMANVYDTRQGETFWAASDIGWVVGHSYIVYAPLLAGCATILYEGKPVGTPDAGAFWRVVSEYGVKVLFSAPTAIRAIRKEDPDGVLKRPHDLSGLKYLFQAGERLDPDTYQWAKDLLGIPVIDHWWQTETGWSVAADPMGLDPKPTKPGSPTFPMPGYDVRILDPDGREAETGQTGDIAIKLPLPPGCLTTLWQNEEGFQNAYLSRYPGYYTTGDGGYRDEDGYLYVMGRTDDVINVAGHRLSTGEMEEILASHPEVAECAVVGVADELKGELPRGFVVLRSGADADPDALTDELSGMIRKRIGAIATLKSLNIVPALPKTRSGKILRKTMRQIANGTDAPVPSTIEDPAVLDALRPVLAPSEPGGE